MGSAHDSSNVPAPLLALRSVRDPSPAYSPGLAETLLRAVDETIHRQLGEAGVGVALLSPQEVFTYANQALADLLGRPTEELIGCRLSDVVHSDDMGELRDGHERLLAGSSRLHQADCRCGRPDGSFRWVDWTSGILSDADGKPSRLVAQIQDVTQRKLVELRNARLQRLANVVAAANRAVLRATAAQQLLEAACEIAVDQGEFRMAWVGRVGPDGVIKPVAWAGAEEGFCRSLQIRLHHPEEAGAPTATAVRSGEPACSNDLTRDPHISPWRDEALRRGYRAAAAFPLRGEDEVIGALAVYAAEAGFFDAEELALLEDLTADISFGLVSLERGDKRQAAETHLAATEARLRAIFERGGLAIVVIDLTGRFLQINPAAEELLGYSSEELRGRRVAELTDGGFDNETPLFSQLAEGQLDRYQCQRRFIHRSGDLRLVRVTANNVRGSDGNPEFLVGMLEDLTEGYRTREALRNAERRLHEAFDQASIGMALLGANGRWMEVNTSLCRLLGRSPEELIRMTFADVSHPDDLAAALAGRRRLLDELVRSHQGQQRFVKADGSVVWALLSVTLLSGVAPGEPAFFLQSIDITAQKQATEALAESEARLRAIFEQGGMGIALNSLEGQFLEANPATLELFGYDIDELRTLSLADLAHPDDCDPGNPLAELARGKISSHQIERRYLRANGETIWAKVTLTPLPGPDGRPRLVIALLEDVTERKRAEQAVAEAHLALERHAAELERSNSELAEFAYIASHDLSEPLRTISGFAELLWERYGGHLDADADEFVHFIVDAANRMQTLINDLLTYSRVDSHAKPLVEVSATELAEAAVGLLKEKIDQTGAKVTITSLPTVWADPNQLSQVLRNLLTNALTFVAPGVTSQVEVSAEREARGWRFVVTDNGIGVDPRHQERIFRMFQRLHRWGDYPGSGIGLAVCKKVVERHGGRLWVEPAPTTGGSRFCFTVPDQPQTRR